MKSNISIATLGEIETLVGRTQQVTAGAGEFVRVAIPTTIPSKNRLFIVEGAAVYITDDNINGTNAQIYPSVAAPNIGFGLILPAGAPLPAGATGVDVFGPEDYTFASLGPAVPLQRLFANAGAGTSRSTWVITSDRRIFIPQGYTFAAYVVDPGDAVAHIITATIMAQVRWLDMDECVC
jgi:hypothetical protein